MSFFFNDLVGGEQAVSVAFAGLRDQCKDFKLPPGNLKSISYYPQSPSLLGSICGRACVRWNSNRASVCKINRYLYKRMYPVTLVHPDGSTIEIRYKEPRQIITLPIDIETLTLEQKKLQLQKRKPKRVLKIVDDFEDDFNVDRYSHLWKR